MTDHQQGTRAGSLEQDMLWPVLDQNAVPDILAVVGTNWNAGVSTAWAALLQQTTLGRLRAYRGRGPFLPIDLTQVSLEEAAQDHELFVEPTEQTHLRLNEISEQTASTESA